MFSKINQKLNFNKRLSLSIPYFLIATFLIILPLVLIVFSAFKPLEGGDNTSLVTSTTTWNIIWRSLRIGIASSLLCVIIGFPFAYFISTSKSAIFKVYAMTLILSPMAIFTIARIYSIRTLFVNIFDDENKLNKEWFLVLGLTYLNLPLMIMPLYTVLKDMPKNIVEASHDMGYSTFQTLVKVVIPYALKATISGFGMVFLSGATTFVISAKLLPDGSQNQTIGDVINSSINPGNKYDLAKGSTLVLVVSSLFILIYSLIIITPRIIIKFKKGFIYE
ncbi:ABC transporter permease [Mycoplasma sp. Ms02]|uniref:ABC transporter permease n=1 Tax=Mycoplasma sp. Ms02 TaxID=353851 RepID=UPI001C89C85A|nr:ABC transporter permease [Mycoplasma sp. Ms02]QZE12444.1 ABC transporter permease [Mycoplasma sp. Ms02]